MANDIKSMTLAEANAYKQKLKDSGKSLSTSKEMGKVENYIKTLAPEKYGKETVDSAYTKLSSGVTQRGGWTESNLPELSSRGISTMLDPVSTGGEDINGALNNYQQGVYDSAGSPELREQISAQLEPEGDAPDALNRIEEYSNMREELGLGDLETSLNDLKAQLEEEYALKRARTQDAEGKTVSMGVIGGRVSEIERQETERIDAIGRQMNVINDQLQTAYSTISTMIQYMGLDYQDAKERYDDEYKKNLDMYKLVDDEMDEQVAAARANLQVYSNAITSGNMIYSELSGSEKTMIAKLEAQSGLPIGFISSLNMSVKDRLMGTSSDGTQAWILDESGNLTTIATGLPSNNNGTGNTTGAFSPTTMTMVENKFKELDIEHNAPDDYGDKPDGDKQFSPLEWEAAKEFCRQNTDSEAEAENLFTRAMKSYGGLPYEGAVDE